MKSLPCLHQNHPRRATPVGIGIGRSLHLPKGPKKGKPSTGNLVRPPWGWEQNWLGQRSYSPGLATCLTTIVAETAASAWRSAVFWDLVWACIDSSSRRCSRSSHQGSENHVTLANHDNPASHSRDTLDSQPLWQRDGSCIGGLASHDSGLNPCIGRLAP